MIYKNTKLTKGKLHSMKQNIALTITLSIFSLMPVFASNVPLDQEDVTLPTTRSTALAQPSFSVADIDPIERMQMCQKFLYQKVLKDTHTLEEGLLFLELTKKLQDLGMETLFPKAQENINKQKAQQ